MEIEEKFIAYINGELSAGEEQEILRVIAEDDELRNLLRFELQLSQDTPLESLNTTFDQQTVPQGFTDRVMLSIEQEQEQKSRDRASLLTQGFQTLKNALWERRTLQWRPVYGMLASILLVFSVIYLLQTPNMGVDQNTVVNIQESQQQYQNVAATTQHVMLRFVYIDDQAQSIAVAGDFSNWEPIPLSQKMVNGKKVWTGMVKMSRGEHNYMFRVDGEKWVTDPMASVQRDDGFGNKNAVIYL
jgi:anti-sigma-K factor RskA